MIRKGSATAQFCVTRPVLSLLSIFSFSAATIDDKHAYLQSDDLLRDIYLRPSKDWTTSPYTVWKLLRRAYALVESTRSWKLTVEKWLTSREVLEIAGLHQLFVQRNVDGSIQMALAKAVDDMLIVDPKEVLDKFYTDNAKRFQIERYIVDKQLIFNGLRIIRSENGCVQYDIKEYKQSIAQLQLTKELWRQQLSICTFAELTDSFNFTGKRN